jgi:putative transcriptional regulator
MNEASAGIERDFSWEEVGRRIRDMRLARRMSQAHLASACNLTGPGVFVIEKGTINPQLKSLQAIAKALGCSVRQLLTGSTATRTDHDDLLEQMKSVLASKDEAAILALLNGLQSAQLILQSRPKGRGGLTVKPSEEVLRMLQAAGDITIDELGVARLGRPSSKLLETFRDMQPSRSSVQRKSTVQEERK